MKPVNPYTPPVAKGEVRGHEDPTPVVGGSYHIDSAGKLVADKPSKDESAPAPAAKPAKASATATGSTKG